MSSLPAAIASCVVYRSETSLLDAGEIAAMREPLKWYFCPWEMIPGVDLTTASSP